MKKLIRNPVLSWMRDIAGKRQWNIVFLLIFQTAWGVTGIGYALILRDMIDGAVAGSRETFIRFSVYFAGLVMIQILLRAAIRYLGERSCSMLENCFKSHMFSKLLSGEYAEVSATHSGEWMNRLTSDTVVVADGMTHILPEAAGMVVRLVCAVAALIVIEPRFGIIVIPGGVLMILLSYAFRRVLKRLHVTIREKDGALRVFMQEHLGSLMIVRSFGREKNVLAESEMLMDEHRGARMNRNHFSNFCNVGFAVLMRGAYVFGAIYGGAGILHGTMSYGTFTAILQLVGQVQNPFSNISGYLPRFYAMLASAERLMEADAIADEMKGERRSDGEIAELYESSFTGIAMRDVCFSYAGSEETAPTVFSGLDISIKKGQYVAFTGHSGCGKSTALKLLMALYKPDSGECVIETADGDIALTPEWRGLFAYVPQGNQLLSGTIRQIVSFGDREKMLSEDKLWEALRIACADEFVSSLEKGLDTELGEFGAGLSEGQMQRIAIARAVFSERPVLLLDESTSSLDENTEARLLRNLRDMTDKTVLTVTHRKSVLSVCDSEIEFT